MKIDASRVVESRSIPGSPDFPASKSYSFSQFSEDGGDNRFPPCKGSALPTELSARTSEIPASTKEIRPVKVGARGTARHEKDGQGPASPGLFPKWLPA